MSSYSIDHQCALVARAAALSVAPYLRSVARTVTSFDTKTDSHDPVTVHDRHVEGLLHGILGFFVPGSRVLGEEQGEVTLSPLAEGTVLSGEAAALAQLGDAAEVHELGDRLRWIVDPIDGTANFACGMAYFGTSIAAELDGQIIAGAVSVPLLHEVFVANATRAWHEGPEGSRELRAQGPRSESEAVLISYYPTRKLLHDDPLAAANRERRLVEAYMATRRSGACALDLAHIAAGWLGAMIGTAFKPWDVAAGIHMVRVAGGTVVNLPLCTDLTDGYAPGVAASVGSFDAVTIEAVLREEQASYIEVPSEHI